MSPRAPKTIDSVRETDFDETIPVDTILSDRYRIIRQLGQGGMGRVYLAEHERVGRSVAIKVLGTGWLGHQEVARRFRDEARAASAVGHPSIIDVFDADELPDGRPYLVMEYLEGRELYEIIVEQAPMPVDMTCRLIRDVAAALEAAHSRSVIHRDLKPENVMVIDKPGFPPVKVLDFGVAALRDSPDRPMTVVGHVMGTPMYMAPEQARGATVTDSVDLYALGVLLHECLTGKVPFGELGPRAMLMAKVHGTAPSVATLRPDLPVELVELVDQCLEVAPADRPANAGEIVQRLQAVLDRRASVVGLAPPPATSTGGTLRWLLPVAALLLALVGVVYLLDRDPDGSSVPDADSARAEVPERDEPAPPPDPGPDPEPIPAAVEEEAVEEPPVEEPPVEADAVEEPRPVEPVAAASPVPDSPRCWRTRKRATDARQVHDWQGLLRHTRARECWEGHETKRRRMRVKAYMELGDWSACVGAGRGQHDPEIRKFIELCRRRQEKG